MKQSPAATGVARQVELIIRRLSSLSTLPSVAANFLSEFSRADVSPSSLSQIIETDPALTARILSLAKERNIAASSVAQAIENLPVAMVRDAILSVKVFQVFDTDYDPDKTRALPRKQLAIHAIAVACASRQIAQMLTDEPAVDPQIAFSAGLLHDIGKLAIDEVMPKSFERVVAEARAAGASAADIERKYLGLDHCIVGKRLAEKWGLPQQAAMAIWLHHSDPDAISQNTPDARIAQIVRLADNIARACQLGDSGSYDEPECSEIMLNSLGLTAEQIDSISEMLPQLVADKTKPLAMDTAGNASIWCQAIQNTAAAIAKDNTKLLGENYRLQEASELCGFITEFLSAAGSTMPAIDTAAAFAAMVQKFYKTGSVAVYLPDNIDKTVADAVVINQNGRAEFFILQSPPDAQFIPPKIQTRYELLDAFGNIPWLFEQMPVQFDASAAKIAPLISNGNAVAAAVIEFRDTAVQEPMPNFESAAGTAAAIIALAKANYNQQLLSEQLVQTLGQLKQTQQQLAEAQSFEAVAELAAGAAHELNNPLAVISGRAQLLAEVEQDQNKKQMLGQIEERAKDISAIIADLMAFARPQPAQRGEVSVLSIVNAALEQTSRKHNIELLETKIENIDALPNICVDGTQIAAAIANVLSNALESYPGGNGPISISGKYVEAAKVVHLEMSDEGCGMDNETLRKAMLPFFSAKSAGRKRGMGLAQAQRLIQLSGGSIQISSQIDLGTKVTICLPILY